MSLNYFRSRISDEDIRRATLLQKITASAILVDKARLCGNDDTEQIEQKTGAVLFKNKGIGESD